MAEKESQRQEPGKLIRSIFSNTHNLEALSDKKQGRKILSKVERRLGEYTPEATLQFTHIILDGIATQWELDTREKALDILKLVPFATKKLDRKTLLEIYVGHLSSLGDSLDPLGSVYSLLEAGLILAPHFPTTEEAKSRIAGALDKTTEKLQDLPGIKTAITRIEEIKQCEPSSDEQDDVTEVVVYEMDPPTRKKGDSKSKTRIPTKGQRDKMKREIKKEELRSRILVDAKNLYGKEKKVVEMVYRDGRKDSDIAIELGMKQGKVAKIRLNALLSIGEEGKANRYLSFRK